MKGQNPRRHPSFPAGLLLLLSMPAVLAVPAVPAGTAGAPATPRLEDRVTDLAGVFSAERRRALVAELAAHEAETSHQIAVLTVPTLSGESIESFSLRVANEWGIGQEGRDNGILVTMALAEHEVRIEVGKGLESTIPDTKAREIIDAEMVPAFRRGDHAGGLEAGVRRLMRETPAAGGAVECRVDAKVLKLERREAVTAEIAKALELNEEAVGRMGVAKVEITVLAATPKAGQPAKDCAGLVGKSGPVVVHFELSNEKVRLQAGEVVQLDYWALPGFAYYGVPGGEVWSIGLGPAGPAKKP